MASSSSVSPAMTNTGTASTTEAGSRPARPGALLHVRLHLRAESEDEPAATELGEVPRRLRRHHRAAGEGTAISVPIVSADVALAPNAEATYGLFDDSVNQIPAKPAASADDAVPHTLDGARSVQ